MANDHIDITVEPGEVHALLGENGAGKSTLSNIFTGLYRADAGHLEVDGVPVAFSSPRDAIDAGIGMVHQHFMLVPVFTVAENIALGAEKTHGGPAGWLDRRRARREVVEVSQRYGLPVDPDALVENLPVGAQQRVEIVKALTRDVDLLILDEPTAVLTPQEAEGLFAVLRRMTDEGRSVVFISHKLDEVRAVADRVTVMRDGRSQGARAVAGTTTRELARLMVGRDVLLGADHVPRAPVASDQVRLALRGVSAMGDRGGAALAGVDLDVRAGEIVGVCGVAGNGQRELAEVIGGTRAATEGTVTIAGTPLRKADPRRAQRAGLALVPEDRLHTGLAPSLPVEDNLALVAYRRGPLSTGPFVRRSRIRARARDLIGEYDVRCPGPTTPTRVLSGGNVQKVLLARELSSDPQVLVAASPTRGLDVGAIESVRALIVQAAERGVGVLLLSEDLDEILSLSDRIAVIYEGRLVATVDRADADVEELGLLMGGDTAHRDGAGAAQP